ncbi:DUF2937 family protein [uncultured Roseibium sp.]|uniref:DUF2937 family protein n=1 Tax=uncultured Roseibium sp. TaxID=1936171 RepID=UPI003217A14B
MGRIIMLLVAIVTGTATSQLPEFAQQYRQRMGGAIDALRQVMADFEADATGFGLSVDEAIARMKTGDDGFSRKRGLSMERTQERLERLTEQKQALASAGPFARLAVVFKTMDPDIAEATVKDYEPALPVTVEGAISAGLGCLAGLLGARLFVGLGRLGRRRTRAHS